MAAVVLYSDIIFAITQHLTERDDLLTWRGLYRHIEPQITNRLLATRTAPICLRSEEDIMVFHRMLFRGESHRGRLAGFTGHVELSVGHIPQTHLQLVLDIFEHAQGITRMSVRDFDTTLSSFLLPVHATETEPHSDERARTLLACWARNRSLTRFCIDYRLVRWQPATSPCEWRSDDILEEERFPFVTDLTVHLGGKPISKWHGGWQVAFPNMTRLTLKFSDSGASLGQGHGGQAIQVETQPRQEDNMDERDLTGTEGEDKDREEAEAAAETDEGDHEETGGEGGGSLPPTGEVEVEEALERNGDDDDKAGQIARPPPRGWGCADH